MLKAKVCVLVSGGGTNLQAIIDAVKSGIINSAEVSVVVASNPSAYALERAKNNGIPTEVVHKKAMPSQEAFEQAIIDIIEKYEIDFIVLAGFMCILSENFTKRYPERIINVHPSLIPSFCGKGFYGLKVHEAALSYGVKVTGATVHFVNEIPDGGRIIMQKAVDIEDTDTPETLQKRVMENAEWIILPQSVEKVAQSIIELKK
ncbi:MAG: phosphoribosylglycinamide formyltransferase [Clostridia bacterium]|nr:phosphoribosylglycinamide formyltransferase [Clostridia bacterium]